MLAIVALLVLADPAPDAPSEPPANVKAYLDAAEAARLAEMADHQSTIKDRPAWATKKDLATAKKRLAALKAGELATPKLPIKAGAGAVGTLPDGKVRIAQVLSSTEAIVVVEWDFATVRASGNRIVAGSKTAKADFLLRGVDTSAWADDRRVDVAGVFEVDGKYSYETTDGDERTLFVLKPFDLAAVEPWLPKPKKGAKPVKKKPGALRPG